MKTLTPGHSKHPLYKTWVAMRQRCNNPKNPDYRHYGGRGVKVCKRWGAFDNFIADMGDKPSPELSIDRIDVNGDYEPSNCRWATQVEQQNNRGVPITNTSGYLGISRHSPSGKWRVRKNIDGQRVSLGLYRTIEEAVEAQGAS